MQIRKQIYIGMLSCALMGFLMSTAFAGIEGDLKITQFKPNSEIAKEVYRGKFYQDGKFTKIDYDQPVRARKEKTVTKKVKIDAKVKTAKKAPAKTEVKQKPKIEFRKKTFVMDQQKQSGMVVMHQSKRYMNVDFTKGTKWDLNFFHRYLAKGAIPFDLEFYKKVGLTSTKLKEESFKGQKCEVWRVHGTFGPSKIDTTMWVAKDWGNIALKIKSDHLAKGVVITEVSNLKKNDLAAATFKHPKAYKAYAPKIQVQASGSASKVPGKTTK